MSKPETHSPDLTAAIDTLSDTTRYRFKWAMRGVALLVALVLVQSFFYKRAADDRAEEARAQATRMEQLIHQFVILQAQENCYHTVQGNYIQQIGLLADSNGAALRGEPTDPVRNLARVKALRAASVYVAHLPEICYNERPDVTPLDGDTNNDGAVDIRPEQ